MEPVPIPSSADVRRLLECISVSQLRDLAVESGVPFGTIYKIAKGETTNPGIETTRRFYGVALRLAQAAGPRHVIGTPTQQLEGERRAA